MDPTLSFPYVTKEKISTSTLVLLSLVLPAIVTMLVCLFFVPGPTVHASVPRSLVWRRKIWEWNVAWLGLALSLVTAFLITNGLKNLFGKPRPDLLSRCNPDLSRIAQNTVGGYGDPLTDGVLVSWQICQNLGDVLDDGFRSFPSGHASCEHDSLPPTPLH